MTHRKLVLVGMLGAGLALWWASTLAAGGAPPALAAHGGLSGTIPERCRRPSVQRRTRRSTVALSRKQLLRGSVQPGRPVAASVGRGVIWARRPLRFVPTCAACVPGARVGSAAPQGVSRRR